MPRLRTLVLLLGDIVVLICSYIFSSLLLRQFGTLPELDLESFLLLENGWQQISIAVATLILGLYFVSGYDYTRVRSRRFFFEDLMLVFGVAFLCQALASYSKSNLFLSRWLMLLGSCIAVVVFTTWRFVYSLILLRVVGRQRVLMVGYSELAAHVASFVEKHPESGYQVIGYVAEQGAIADSANQVVLPISDQLQAQITELRPDRISVIPNLSLNNQLSLQLLACSMSGLRVEDISDLFEELFQRVALETITPNQLIFSHAFRPKIWVRILQGFYCRLIAALSLVISAPIMLLTAIAVRIDSPGPVLLQQIRLGENGVPFKFLKFRSMFVNADAISGPVRAKENDPRITRVGRWIRLTRIDEIPQFINVLRGEMNLVGPRPEMPALQAQLLKEIPLYPQRYRVKPGITGWAQIHHEPEDSIHSTIKKLGYDLYYIKNMSPGLDFITMFHTLKAVLLRIGAR